MLYVLAYSPNFKNVRAAMVEDKVQVQQYIANLPENDCGIEIDLGAESHSLRLMTMQALVRWYNALTMPPVKKFKDEAEGRTALFRVIKDAAVQATPDDLKPQPEPEAPPAGEPTPAAEAPAPAQQPTDSPPADPKTTEEADMAKAKTKSKAAKKKAAPKTPKEKKAADGLPRAGSKKAELLRLLQRQNGATMEEMLAATGWKACLGTAKAVTTAAKLKFRHERGTDGKPSRWYAE